MSSVVTCACGQSFKASERIMGKTVACPKCRQPLFIPVAEELLDVLPVAEVDPAPAPYNPYAAPDPLAASSAYPAPAYSTAAPLTSLPPAPRPAGEAAPDLRIVLFAGLGAGGVLLCLVTGIVMSRWLAHQKETAAAQAAQTAANAPANPGTAAPQNIGPFVVSTPAPQPAAKPASKSWFPSFSFNSGVRTVIRDRYEVYAPVELNMLDAMGPGPGMGAINKGVLTDANAVPKAEYVVLLVPNLGMTLNIDRAESHMAARLNASQAQTKRVTVNGKPALHMVGTRDASRVRGVMVFMDDEAMIALVMVKADSSDVGNSAMDRFLYSFKRFK